MSEYIIGRNPVLEALNSGRKINKVFIEKGKLKGSINKIIKELEKENIKIERVNKERLEKLGKSDRHQGIVAEVEAFKYSQIEDILNLAKIKSESPFILILDKIEDPHNLGALIRTANLAGVHGIIISKHRACEVNQTVLRASAGAANYTQVAQVTNINRTIEDLKEAGLWIYGADAQGEEIYFNLDLKGAIGLVIGNEGEGISEKVKEKCDFLVKIPMFGDISSLNASVSGAVLMYEIVRQNYGN